MKIFKPLFLICILSFSLTANAAIDDSNAIEAVNAKLVTALEAGNTSTLTDLYSDTAVMLPPSSEILTTTASIKTYWDELLKAGIQVNAIYPVDLKIKGNIAYSSALWEASRSTSEGEIKFQGNISNVFEKQEDGIWKITLQSWN